MPFHDWTVDSLARRVGVSRTVLAERFKHFLDQPPMQYLSHWRLRVAAHALSSSETPIKAIAGQTGYESEAAFSRAFKRHFGMPPADWRKRARHAAGDADARHIDPARSWSTATAARSVR